MKYILSLLRRYPKWTLALAISWTILIFIGCSMPGKELPKLGLFDHFDKLVHFTFFAVFFVLWYLSFLSSTRTAIIIISLAILYGFGIEFYQKHFVAGRSFDVWDGVADTLGALCGWLMVKVVKIENISERR